VNPGVGKRFSLLHASPDHPVDPPSFLCNRYHGSFLWVTWPWHGVDSPRNLAARFKWGRAKPLLGLCAFKAWYGETFHNLNKVLVIRKK
jgi:hypothetical protein